VILRYFNVAGAVPSLRNRPSTGGDKNPLIKVRPSNARRTAAANRRVRHRLPDPRRHLHAATIHVTDLGRAPCRRARLSAGGRAAGDAQLAATAMSSRCSRWSRRSRRVSVVDFRVDYAARRPAIARGSSRNRELILETLGWRPQFDDLAPIVGHAPSWERTLPRGKGVPPRKRATVMHDGCTPSRLIGVRGWRSQSPPRVPARSVSTPIKKIPHERRRLPLRLSPPPQAALAIAGSDKAVPVRRIWCEKQQNRVSEKVRKY